MPEHPLVTVFVLCYNTGNYVCEALACLRKQTYANLQILICDDASSDNSVALISDWLQQHAYPAQLIRNKKNLGLTAVFNLLLKEAKGEYITWLSDDKWADDRVAKCVTAFQALPDSVGVLFGNMTIIDAQSKRGDLRSPQQTLLWLQHPEANRLQCAAEEQVILDGAWVQQVLFWKCFVPAPSVTVRASIYTRAGKYDESIAIEDLDCWLRTASHFDFCYWNTELAEYRLHESNFSSGKSDRYLIALAAILEKHQNLAKGLAVAAMHRHIREEAYRVMHNLLNAGMRKQAQQVFQQYYLPHRQGTWTEQKETLKIRLRFLRSFVGL